MIKYINLYIVIKLTDLIIPVTHWVILSEIKGKLFQLISRLAAGSCRDVDHAEQVATIRGTEEPFHGRLATSWIGCHLSPQSKQHPIKHESNAKQENQVSN